MGGTGASDGRVGTTLANKYRLIRLLGTGGMGAVYEAGHLRTGRRVAVKLMVGAETRDAEVSARFLREARAAARIEHPNVVQVFDADEDPSDGAPYIVQEFLVGRDPRRLLDERRALSARETFEIIVPILSALIAAHRAGVLHRDLKPENIFLSRSAGGVVPKLIDFGISKLIEGDTVVGSFTRTGAAMGTPYYLSPEQAQGDRTIDAQADVWSVGVVLFEMLSGRMPFVADSYNALLARILMAPVPRVDDVAPSVPRAVANVIAKALLRDRAKRYRGAAQMLGDLLDCQDVGDDAWRSTLQNNHRTATASAEDDLDDAQRVARPAPWAPGAAADMSPARAASTTLGRSAREIVTASGRGSGGRRVVAGAGATGVAMLALVFVWHRTTTRVVAEPASAPINAPPVPAVSPRAPPEVGTYVVSVIAQPSVATFELDGIATHANELARTLPRNGPCIDLSSVRPGTSRRRSSLSTPRRQVLSWRSFRAVRHQRYEPAASHTRAKLWRCRTGRNRSLPLQSRIRPLRRRGAPMAHRFRASDART